MSYILDALRRADAERVRGAVPGVHTQALPASAADADAPPATHRWLAVSAVLALALVAVVGWQWFGRTEPAANPAEPAAVRAPMAVTEPAPPPAPPQSAPPTLPPPPAGPALLADSAAPRAPASAPPAPSRPVPPSVARAAAPATAALRQSAPAPAPAVPASAAAPALPVGDPVPAPPAPATPAAPVRIPLASELPDDVRAGLPVLSIGGASYSQNPESRMLIVNGQVFREGEPLAPELMLEQIRLKEAVLSAHGVRFRIVY